MVKKIGVSNGFEKIKGYKKTIDGFNKKITS